MKVKKAVFPVAGLGTRFLPATKSSPKEMLPLIDKPLVQYVVEEAVASGIEQILFVTGRGKRAIEDHFDISVELETHLEDKGKNKISPGGARDCRDGRHLLCPPEKGAGTWDTPSCAPRILSATNRLPCCWGMTSSTANAHVCGNFWMLSISYHGSVLALEKVPMENISSYGCVRANAISERIFEVIDMVEKPTQSEAPSDMAIIGRYILTPQHL